jgi:uncharacterized SAM-binding protein YcdF (DUF218 family)
VIGLLAAAGALLGLVTLTPLVPWWTRALAGAWSETDGAVLVVLTGSDLDDGILGYSSYWRAVYAVLVWRTRRPTQIWISGGGPMEVPMAESMKTFLVASGVPESLIRIEGQSRSTWESAQRMSRLLEAESRPIALLTSDYHMFRARRMFEKAGLKVSPMPIPDGLKRATRLRLRWWVFLDLVRESAAVVVAWMERRI